jgi:KAP family P-loop domain
LLRDGDPAMEGEAQMAVLTRSQSGSKPGKKHNIPDENTDRTAFYADRPVMHAAQDAYGFQVYATQFALLINDPKTDTPLTVALSGPWGSGKTSLAHLIQDSLEADNIWQAFWDEKPVICWFNAWMHGDAPNLGAALAASVTRQVATSRRLYLHWLSPLPSVMLSPEQRAWRRVWTAIIVASTAFLALMGFLWIFPQFRRTSGPLGHLFGHWQLLTVYAAVPAVIGFVRQASRISDSVGAFIDAPRSAAAQGTLAQVAEQLKTVMYQAQRRWRIPGQKRWHGRAKRRIIIFVDDLERCAGDKALDMCEVVSQLLGHDNVVTVLIADLDLLEAAANVRYSPVPGTPPDQYSDIGQEYLHKLIQLRFNLPPVDRSAVATALGLIAQQGTGKA